MIREQTEMDRSNEYLLQMDATSEKEFIDLKQFGGSGDCRL